MDFISPYIDSEKKLHIRFEKLLSLLLSCGFSGKINVFNGGETFLVILSNLLKLIFRIKLEMLFLLCVILQHHELKL